MYWNDEWLQWVPQILRYTLFLDSGLMFHLQLAVKLPKALCCLGQGRSNFPCLVWISSNHICRGCSPTFLLLPPRIKIVLICSYYWVRKPGEKKASIDIAFKFMWQGHKYVLYSESRDRPGISAKVFQLIACFHSRFELCSRTAIFRHIFSCEKRKKDLLLGSKYATD